MFPRWVWDYIRASAGDGGYAEVRGWKFDVVGPRYNVRPSVSDVTSPCPSRRDVWLRRVKGYRLDGEAIALGRIVHEVFLYPFRNIHKPVEYIVKGFNSIVRSIDTRFKRYSRLLHELFLKSLSLALASLEDGIPISVEPVIPGAVIGLSDHLRPDLLVGLIPVDVALKPTSNKGFERKELALTGYALAIEAWIGHPVDFGVTVYVSFNSEPVINWRIITIDDTLRRRFIELRDRVAQIIEYGVDPGLPDNCPQTCPFYEVCRSEMGIHS